jgi:diguanylate cyclase (GGDEF)-like protein/PAS domain S-box-containing protein
VKLVARVLNILDEECEIEKKWDIFTKVAYHVPGVIYQFRLLPDGRSCFPFATDAIQNIYEVTAEQVREDASAVFNILHPDDYDGVVASIQESAQTLNTWRYEFRVVLPKQGVRWRLGESKPEKLSDGSILWHGFITDVTERKEAELRVKRLTMLYKALSETNKAIIRMQDEDELFPLVCRTAVELGGMKLAWVGTHNQDTELIVPIAKHGSWEGVLDKLKVPYKQNFKEGKSITGTAFRDSKTIIVNDFFNNPLTKPWQDNAKKLGWASVAAFPIFRNAQPFAVLTVCHELVGAFDDETITLLEEMVMDLSFALDNFDREEQRKNAEESLRLAASVYATSNEAILITDQNNVIVGVNPAFTKITGYQTEEVIGYTPSLLKSGKHDDAFFKAMWDEINATGYWQGEIYDQRKNGEVYLKWLTINSVFKEDGTVHQRVAMFTDISQKKEAENLIWRQANFDFLTELPNRQMFHDRLDHEVKITNRTKHPLALILLDLDHFKEVNDTLGHDMGDELLVQTASRLKSCVRETDTVARLGGDEFIIILCDLDKPDVVQRVCLDILQKLREPYYLNTEVAYISASIGVTIYPQDAQDIDTLIKNADQAMYNAKSQGRDRFSYFTPLMQAQSKMKMQIANDLRLALNKGEFWLAYQPIVSLTTGEVHKAEALIRWQHPKRGLVGPNEFIPIAEDTRLILKMGEWVFSEAVKQMAKWRIAYHANFEISINKSPIQFRDEKSDYLSWPEQLRKLGLPGESVVVEITEGMLMESNDTVSKKLLAYRDAGIQVSLDDFGTGYSSLSYLKKFDIDYLKIDKSFISNLEPNSEDMALCEAIIVMAHKLGIKVIAEGVETVEQKELLMRAGCDFAQGYLFSKPIPANAFEELFLSSRI